MGMVMIFSCKSFTCTDTIKAIACWFGLLSLLLQHKSKMEATFIRELAIGQDWSQLVDLNGGLDPDVSHYWAWVHNLPGAHCDVWAAEHTYSDIEQMDGALNYLDDRLDM
ncbi:hypothetical protein EDD17DRAFT_1506949 [Pisolithus thermaeus]|nr:hypothetical protein EV401DRAFT_1889588 [Pisolithus croceorrhizus]KAI6164101.1 hypothetical protein EDD17DRAFT_1506949 [Pisolithus thermaeus]